MLTIVATISATVSAVFAVLAVLSHRAYVRRTDEHEGTLVGMLHQRDRRITELEQMLDAVRAAQLNVPAPAALGGEPLPPLAREAREWLDGVLDPEAREEYEALVRQRAREGVPWARIEEELFEMAVLPQ